MHSVCIGPGTYLHSSFFHVVLVVEENLMEKSEVGLRGVLKRETEAVGTHASRWCDGRPYLVEQAVKAQTLYRVLTDGDVLVSKGREDDRFQQAHDTAVLEILE